MLDVIALSLFLLTPLVAERLSKVPALGWLDSVLTCYAVGILMANLPIPFNAELAQTVSEAVVPLAIPLLLFETNIRNWLGQSRNTIVAFAVAVVVAISTLPITFGVFHGQHPDLASVAGMLTGTWIGGTPNLVSIGAALQVPQETLLLTNTADVLVGGIYLMALLTFWKPLIGRMFPQPTHVTPLVLETSDLSLRERLKQAGLSLTLATLILAVSAGVAMAVTGKLSAPWVILGITTGGIVASLSPRVRALKASFQVGNYLILVFCVAIGSLTDLTTLATAGSTILTFTAVSFGIVVFAHHAICRLFKIDIDTTIIASVATIMGPALVVPVARRLNSQEALVSGVTTGLVGYAAGNYLGFAMAKFLG